MLEATRSAPTFLGAERPGDSVSRAPERGSESCPQQFAAFQSAHFSGYVCGSERAHRPSAPSVPQAVTEHIP